MNYFPLHIGDYAAHTQRLSLMEDLAFRRLLDLYYLQERPIQGSPADVAREIGMTDQLAAVEYVLSKFFTRTDRGYENARCEKEIAHFHDKKTKASTAGKASAERRSNARSTPVATNSTSVEINPTDVPPTRTRTRTRTRTNNQIQGAHVVIGEDARAIPNPGEVCKAMKSVGMASVNPSSPKLASLLAAGITEGELVQAAVDAVAVGKSFAYALATAAGRRADAVREPKTVSSGESFRERDARIGRERWEQMTGETHPDNQPKTGGMVINSTAKFLEIPQ